MSGIALTPLLQVIVITQVLGLCVFLDLYAQQPKGRRPEGCIHIKQKTYALCYSSLFSTSNPYQANSMKHGGSITQANMSTTTECTIIYKHA